MATILFGNGVADVRGSINGTVFSRNANGAYARNRTTPINPQTAAQVTQRGRLTSLSSAWRELTDAQRDTWTKATRAYPYTNRLGQTSYYTGPQLFNKLNLALLSAGQSTLDTPAVPVAFPGLGTFSATMELTAGVLSTAKVDFTGAIPAGFTTTVFASPGVSAGIGSSKYPKAKIESKAGSGGTSVAFLTPYLSKFGSPSLGSRVMIEVRLLCDATGQETLVAQTSAIVE